MARRFLFPMMALALVLGACGTKTADEVQSDDRQGDEQPGEGGNAASDIEPGYLAKVAKDTLARETGRFEMTMSFSGDIEGSSMDGSMTATGEYDNAVPASHVSVDLTSMMEAAMDAAQSSGGGAGMDLFGDVDWTVETIQIGDTIYLRMPMLAMLGSAFGADIDADGWFSADGSEMTGAELDDLTGTTTSGMDPSVYLELLQGASGGVEDLGTVDVRGTSTTGYRVEVSVADAVEAQADAEAVQEMEDMFSQFGASDYLDLTFPVEIYVDDDGAVRRVALDLDFADLAATLGLGADGAGGAGDMGSLTASMTMDFFDLGADDIVIEAPPADQVKDLESLVGGAFGGLEGFGTD